MSYTFKASAASVARAVLGIIAAFLIQNGLTDEKTANDFVSNNVELVAGILVSLLTLLWIVLKNKFSNTAFWQAIFATPPVVPDADNANAQKSAQKVVDRTTEETGLPEMLKF